MNRVDDSNHSRFRKLAKKEVCPIVRLHEVSPPRKCRFLEIADFALAKVSQIDGLKNKPAASMLKKRMTALNGLIEGLYQAYCCFGQSARLAVPLSRTGYSRSKNKLTTQIGTYSQTAIALIIDALKELGFVDVHTGGLTEDNEAVLTTLYPKNQLVENFDAEPFVWEYQTYPADRPLIVLKDLDPNWEELAKRRRPKKGGKRKKRRKKTILVKYAETPHTRKLKENVLRINQNISKHAICLDLDYVLYQRIGARMAREDYWVVEANNEEERIPRPLNIRNVWIHRVFSRGSFSLGGRHYGAWWQLIPKEFRPYILIDGQPTSELDYSEMHPRIMYWSRGVKPPDGDLYDIWLPKDMVVSNRNDPAYEIKRKIVKTYINAKINDELGRYRMEKGDYAKLGLNRHQLKHRVFKKHPILKEVIHTQKGLEFQFIDSEIAENVMFRLMRQGIACLPVFDSFIVQTQFEEELRVAMLEAFNEHLGGVAKLSDFEKLEIDDTYPPTGVYIDPTSDEPVDYSSAKPLHPTNFDYIKHKHTDSFVATYLSTFWDYGAKQLRTTTQPDKRTPSTISGQNSRKNPRNPNTSKE